MSWGTKGSDKAEVLPQANSSKAKGDAPAVVTDVVKGRDDVEEAFKETVARAVSKKVVVEVPERPTLDVRASLPERARTHSNPDGQQDQNKTFRTRLVVLWILSNAALAIAIENINGTPSGNEAVDEAHLQHKQHYYFAFILWTTFALASVRFTGVSVPISSDAYLDG